MLSYGRFARDSSAIMKIKAIKSNDQHDWVCFKRMRNKVNAAIRQAKELFYKNKLAILTATPVKRGR